MGNRKSWLKWSALVAISAGAFLTTVDLSWAAPALRAEVAQVSANGNVVLMKERLVDHFPNGLPVADTSMDISNGFLRLVRKGFKPNGDCFREIASLVDANNIAVPASGVIAHQTLWVIDKTPIAIFSCKDQGCHALKNVVLPGEPPLVYARCDQTDGPCECHINDGSGDSTASGSLCTSFFDKSILQIDSWVLPPYIE